jgi:hypothetical protein
MTRAKSVKPEAAPKPEPELLQINIDKAEFIRTRDAVSFVYPFDAPCLLCECPILVRHRMRLSVCEGAYFCLLRQE